MVQFQSPVYQVNRKHDNMEEILRISVTADSPEQCKAILENIGFEVIMVNEQFRVAIVR